MSSPEEECHIWWEPILTLHILGWHSQFDATVQVVSLCDHPALLGKPQVHELFRFFPLFLKPNSSCKYCFLGWSSVQMGYEGATVLKANSELFALPVFSSTCLFILKGTGACNQCLHDMWVCLLRVDVLQQCGFNQKSSSNHWLSYWTIHWCLQWQSGKIFNLPRHA
jgi:hypothetical protein